MRLNVTVWPTGHLSVPPPADTSLSVVVGSRKYNPSFHANKRWYADSITDGGCVLVNVPIAAVPNLSLLNPPVCAPTTARLTPPYRPSQMRPKRSIKKL